MNIRVCFTAFLLVLCGRLAAQNIFIANSNPGAMTGTRVYTGTNAIADAVLAASSGDIIYVVPSSVMYFGFSINKSVSIIGGGLHPDVPGVGETSTHMLTINADNVRLSGLRISEVRIESSRTNLMIDKCRMRAIQVASASVIPSNVIIQNCLIGEGSTFLLPLVLGVSASSVRISNNIFFLSTQSIEQLNAATIENNLIVGGSQPAFKNVSNCDIKNNIFFYVTLQAPADVINNTYQHNLSFGGSEVNFPVTNGNSSINNVVSQDPLFSNFPLAATFDFSYDLSLQSGSPAIGAGTDGTDIGIFGGQNPFDIYGTSLPVVRELIAPNTVPQGSELKVTIKAKGN